jgi:hypothetical protein
MSSCLDAAGVPNWVFGAEMININPLHEIVYDGYKVVVSEDDLQSALDVLKEAMANPTPCDERLVIRFSPVVFATFHLVQIAMVGMFLWLPMRGYQWLSKNAGVH